MDSMLPLRLLFRLLSSGWPESLFSLLGDLLLSRVCRSMEVYSDGCLDFEIYLMGLLCLVVTFFYSFYISFKNLIDSL